MSPEVFFAACDQDSNGGCGEVLSSLAIDLFSLGLLIEVLCRPECGPSTTALPSPHFHSNYQQQLRVLLKNQHSLYEIMDSLKGSHSQTAIVRDLLKLKPTERGTAESIKGQRD